MKVQLMHSPPTLTCLVRTFRRTNRGAPTVHLVRLEQQHPSVQPNPSPFLLLLLFLSPGRRIDCARFPLLINKRFSEINHYFVLISRRLLYGGAISYLIKTNCLSLTSTEFFLQLSDINKYVLVAPSPSPPSLRPRKIALTARVKNKTKKNIPLA